MPALLEAQSTLTTRYQTTVPETVRRALNLRKNDKLFYSLRENGEIVISRAERPINNDPTLEAFLQFLNTDMQQHPEHLQPASAQQRSRIQALTRGMNVDLNQALAPDE